MPHPLDGVRAKIKRTNEQLDNLNAALEAFLNTKPYGAIAETDGQDSVIRASGMVEPPPVLSVLVGEVAHNLRSALDHLIWQLVIVNGRHGNRKTGFPVFKDREEYEATGKGKIERIPLSAQTLVERVQPYHAGNDFRNHALYCLHQLNLIDKHRTIYLLAAASIANFSGVGLLQLGRAGLINNMEISPPRIAFPIDNGTELYRIRGGAMNINVQVKCKLTFTIAFGIGEPFEGEPIMPALVQLRDFTSATIKLFESFFAHENTPNTDTSTLEG